MSGQDTELARKVRGIIAVLVEDIDAVMSDVEDGVAYIEGVVPSAEYRQKISRAVGALDGIDHVITCLCTERILSSALDTPKAEFSPTAGDYMPMPTNLYYFLS